MKAKIIAFGVVLVLLLCATVGMASALSNSGGGDWKYYKELTVKENSGNTLTDYQVLVELNPSNFPANAKSDGSDLRFEDANGKELSYGIEEWDAGAKRAKIWVKMLSIPANGKTTIRLRYGNPSAGAVSDGDKVFEFFDDFEDGDIYDWTQTGTYNMIVSDGAITSPATADPVSHNTEAVIRHNINLDIGDYVVENRYKTTVTDWTGYQQICIGYASSGGTVWHRDMKGYVGYLALYHPNDLWTGRGFKIALISGFELDHRNPIATGPIDIRGTTDWITTHLVFTADGSYRYYSDDGEGYDSGWVSDRMYSQPFNLILQMVRSQYGKVDWIRIRKYTSPEPTTIKFSPEYPTAKPTPAATPTPVPTPIQEHIKFIVTPSGEGIYNITYTEYAPFTVNVLRYSDGNGVAGIPIYQLEPKEFEKATKEYLQRKAPDIIGTKLTERAVTKIIENAGVDIISGPFGITIEVMSDIATLFDYLSYLTTPYIDLGAITDNEGKATLYLPNRAYTTTMDMSGFITQMDEPIDLTAPATQEQIAEQIASILLPTVQEELQPVAYKDITLAIPTKISIDDKGVITTETAEELKTYTEYHAINSKEEGNSRELTFWVEPRAIPPTTIGTGKEEEKMMKAHVLSQDRNLFPHVVSLSHYFQNKGIKCGYIDLIGHLADINEWVALNSPLESRWPSPEDDFTVVISSKEDKPKWKQTIKQFPQETVLQGSGWEVTKYTQTSADISGEHERFIFSIVVTDDEKREEAIKAFIENADPLGMPIEKEKEMPGFVAVFAVAGLLVVVYVLKRKK